MKETFKQSTIDKATALGFKISDRLEYRLDTDTGLDNGKLVYFRRVVFPPGHPFQKPQAVYDDAGLLSLIRCYNNRFEDAKKDAEFSKHSIEAISKLKDIWNKEGGT